jgi:hypothetical protein
MSMDKIYHVLQKSQSKGSARLLLVTVAIHANECCGVAWPSDETLRREANVSRQRIHELKQQTKGTGELCIIERPGYTNLYFIADGGKPVGLTPQMLLDATRKHERGCPLRDPAQALRVAKFLFETPSHQPREPAAALPDISSISPELMQEFGIRHHTGNWPPRREPTRSGAAAPPVDNSSDRGEGVPDPPDPHVSEGV